MSLDKFLNEAENHVASDYGFLNFYWSRKLIRIVRELHDELKCYTGENPHDSRAICLKRCDEISDE
jgi:hypothetical protein